MTDWLESALRGAGKGATLGWNDEGAAGLLASLPDPQDPEGIPREYAAGSQAADYRQKFRRDDSAAASAHPGVYTASALAGGVPLALSVPGAGGLTAAGRVAAGGLTGGALGAVGGAGMADGKQMAQEAAKGALAGGVLGTGGAALAEDLPLVMQLARAEPALATAGAGLGGPQINRAMASGARSPSGNWAMPSAEELSAVKIPANKAPFRESQIPKLDEIGEKADLLHADKLRGVEPSNAAKADYQKTLGEFKDKPKVEQTEASVAKTGRPPRKAMRPAAPPPEPTQAELPLPSPEYSYHATPKSNADAIAELGLRPEQGGKNFNFAKNKDKIYLSHEADAPMWAKKLEDTTGEPALKLRTPLSSKAVPGANAAVRTRSEPVPPERLQFQEPSTGVWKSVKGLRQEPPAAVAPSAEQLSLEDILRRK